MTRYIITRPVWFTIVAALVAPFIGGALLGLVVGVPLYVLGVHAFTDSAQEAAFIYVIGAPVVFGIYGLPLGFIPAFLIAVLSIVVTRFWRGITALELALAAAAVTFIYSQWSFSSWDLQLELAVAATAAIAAAIGIRLAAAMRLAAPAA